MKNIMLFVTIIALCHISYGSVAFAQSDDVGIKNLSGDDEVECSCNPFPFTPDPPCFEVCAVNFIALAPKNEVYEILEVQESTVESVRAFYSQILEFQSAPDISVKFGEYFSPEEAENLRGAFENSDTDRLQDAMIEVLGK